MESLWKYRRQRGSQRHTDGISLIELLITLSLLLIVLSLGYTLFSFGYNTFFIAEGRSDVQQNVRIVSDYIARELRHSSTLVLWDSSKTIPATLDDEENVIFVDEYGKVRHRTEEGDTILVEGISERIIFELGFGVSAISNRILEYQVTGIRDNGQTNLLGTDLFLQNLDFLNKDIETEGSNFTAVYYIKPPAATSFQLSIAPYFVYRGDGYREFEFTLTLTNDAFADTDPNDIELELAFMNMSVDLGGFERDSDDHSIATLSISGDLASGYGTGLIRIGAGSLVSGHSLEGRVLVLVPVGILTALPSPVTAASPFNQVFTLALSSENAFAEDFDLSDITLAGDLEGLEMDSFVRISSQAASVGLYGDLVHSSGAGTIMVSGRALTESVTGLEARITIVPEGTSVYTVTVSSAGNGTTVPSGERSYTAGEDISILASPATNWMFMEWTVNEQIKIDNPLEILVDGNKDVTAYFRMPFSNIPTGSYVRYGSVEYIKLPGARLLAAELHMINGSRVATSWNSSDASQWATLTELQDLSQSMRTTGFPYWTATEHSASQANYVESNGALARGSKDSQYNIRKAITVDDPADRYVDEGAGTADDPFILQ